MRTFVVPRGTPLVDGGKDAGFQWDTSVRQPCTSLRLTLQLRPYVSKLITPAMLDQAEAEWPRYGPRGFDGHYMLRLVEHLCDVNPAEDGVGTIAEARKDEQQRHDQARRREETDMMGTVAQARAKRSFITAPWERRRDADGAWDDVRPMVQGPVAIDSALASEPEPPSSSSSA